MWTLAWVTVAFLLVSAGVAALARGTTARWERERERRSQRAGRRVRPPDAERRPGGMAARLGHAVAEVHVRGVPGAVRRGVDTSVRRVPQVARSVRQNVVHPRHPRLRRTGAGPERVDAPAVDVAGTGPVEPPEEDHAVHLVRRRSRAGVPDPTPGGAVPRLTHRLAARWSRHR